MTQSFRSAVVGEDANLLLAIEAIDRGGCRMAVVVDADQHVVGLISDGDVRRAILRGVPTSAPVTDIMNRHPQTIRDDVPTDEVLATLRQHVLAAIPRVDQQGRLVDLVTVHDVLEQRSNTATAVIMAGGEGRRLRPFTETIPKPMMEVGDKPLIEHTVNRLAKSGLRRMHVAVNYLAEKIQGHLGDGADFGAHISYLEEQTKLGTAGALSLLPADQDGPLLVLNGDILTDVDFSRMLAFHAEENSALTIGVVEYHIQIPYGVIGIENSRVVGLTEKPEQRMPISAGIYVIESRLLSLIPPGVFYNMTDFIADTLKAGERVSPFLIHEQWIDIGTAKDLERARALTKGNP